MIIPTIDANTISAFIVFLSAVWTAYQEFRYQAHKRASANVSK